MYAGTVMYMYEPCFLRTGTHKVSGVTYVDAAWGYFQMVLFRPLPTPPVSWWAIASLPSSFPSIRKLSVPSSVPIPAAFWYMYGILEFSWVDSPTPCVRSSLMIHEREKSCFALLSVLSQFLLQCYIFLQCTLFVTHFIHVNGLSDCKLYIFCCRKVQKLLHFA